MTEKILIIDFGSQYTQLIARRVRELNVYCEIHPFNHLPEIDESIKGVIMSGSPFSVRDAQAPRIDLGPIKGRLPLLGVCYGAQYLAHFFGGEVSPAPSREYGRAMLTVKCADDPLMKDLPQRTQVWMSHGDTITRIPEGYESIASTDDVELAAYRIAGEPTWAIQFHPEVYHSTDGKQLLKNFVVGICGCAQSWTSESFVESTVAELKAKLEAAPVFVAAQVGDEGQLFGSVTSTMIAEAAAAKFGIELDKRRVELKAPIKTAGEFEVAVSLYRTAKATLKVLVGAEEPVAAEEPAAEAAPEAEEVAAE